MGNGFLLQLHPDEPQSNPGDSQDEEVVEPPAEPETGEETPSEDGEI